MADNITLNTPNATVRTTESGGVHTTHHIIEDAAGHDRGANVDENNQLQVHDADVVAGVGAADDAEAEGDGSVIAILKRLRTSLQAIASQTELFSPVDGETVSLSATSAQSSALPGGRVRLYGTSAFHVLVGDDPTATEAAAPYPAGESVYLHVPTSEKVAVIKVSGEGDGTVWVATEAAIS